MWQERDATHASCRSVLVYFLSFFLECQIVRLIIFMIYFPNPRDQCSKVDFSSMCVPLEHWTRGWGFAVFLFYTFRIRKTKKHTHQAEFSLRLFLPHRDRFWKSHKICADARETAVMRGEWKKTLAVGERSLIWTSGDRFWKSHKFNFVYSALLLRL